MREYKFTSPLEIGDTCWLVENFGSWEELCEFKADLKITKTKVVDIKFTLCPDWHGMIRSYRIADPYGRCKDDWDWDRYSWYYLYEDSVSSESEYLKDIERCYTDIIFTTKEDAEKVAKKIEDIYRGFRENNK